MENNEMTAKIIGLCMKVHRELGPGLLESVYELALCYELNQSGLRFTRQTEIPIHYDGRELGIGFRADIIVENNVIIELKSIEVLAPIHSKQLLTYLRLAKKRYGLLINFNNMLLKDGIVRLVNGY